MPVIFEVTALYRRTVQPKDYESATGEVGLKAQLEDGDNVDDVVSALLHKCRDLTMKAVTGKKLGRTEAEVEVTKKEVEGRDITDKPEDRGEALPGEEADTSEADAAAAKKAAAAEKRKATAAKKKADAAAAAEAALPGEEDSGDYDASAFADEAAGISATDLQHFISTTVSNKQITVPKAKEIMSQFGDGAGRVKDIPVEKRDKVYEEIQGALAVPE